MECMPCKKARKKYFAVRKTKLSKKHIMHWNEKQWNRDHVSYNKKHITILKLFNIVLIELNSI